MAVGGAVYGELLNLCVWNKSNAGMGSLYRSKHELVFVYRVGKAPHFNAVELGRHGRNRTNVWDYASVNSMAGSRREDLALHPTVKPTALVADAHPGRDPARRAGARHLPRLGHDADRGGTHRPPVPRPRHRSGLCRCRARALVGDDRRRAAARRGRRRDEPAGRARQAAGREPLPQGPERQPEGSAEESQAAGRLGLRHRHRQDAHGDPGRHAARGDRRGGAAAPHLPGRDRRQPLRPARDPEDDRQARAVSGRPAGRRASRRSSSAIEDRSRATPTRRC